MNHQYIVIDMVILSIRPTVKEELKKENIMRTMIRKKSKIIVVEEERKDDINLIF